MKIQYKSEPIDVKYDNRYIRFRIVPSELSWWKRTFKNPWRYVYSANSVVFSFDSSVHDCLNFLFSLEEANEIVSKYDTYEKLIDFLTLEFNKAETIWNEAQERSNRIW